MSDLYQSQRAMRNMRRQAMQRGVIAVLDIGTSKIACLLLKFDDTASERAIDGVSDEEREIDMVGVSNVLGKVLSSLALA